jgi:hypothetical protein
MMKKFIWIEDVIALLNAKSPAVNIQEHSRER